MKGTGSRHVTSGGGRPARAVALGAVAAGLALAASFWPGPPPGPLAGQPGLPLGAPAAFAGDEWCDTDPILVIHTPGNHDVPVYYLTGVQTTTAIGNTLLAILSAGYTVTPAQGGTQVTVNVTVPNGVGANGVPTRLTVSSGPWGTGTVYGTATGTSGSQMTVGFFLPVQ